MDIYALVGQAIGIVAMFFTIFSFQCKKNRNLFIMQGLGGLFFSINFIMLKTYTAAFMNIISIFRSILLSSGKNGRKWYFFVLIILINTIATIFTYDGWLSLLTFAAQIIGTAAMWTDNGKTIRVCQFFLVSPAWLTHNVLVGSIGATICEGFNLISIIVYAVRTAIGRKKKTPLKQNNI